jgi:mRNA interferase MazF
LKRGDLYYVQFKGPYTTKPRPAVIVQSTDTLELRASVTVCMLTGDLHNAPLARVRVSPNSENGLAKLSDVMIDKVSSVPKAALDPARLGRLTDAQMARVDQSLRFWLDLP